MMHQRTVAAAELDAVAGGVALQPLDGGPDCPFVADVLQVEEAARTSPAGGDRQGRVGGAGWRQNDDLKAGHAALPLHPRGRLYRGIRAALTRRTAQAGRRLLARSHVGPMPTCRIGMREHGPLAGKVTLGAYPGMGGSLRARVRD